MLSLDNVFAETELQDFDRRLRERLGWEVRTRDQRTRRSVFRVRVNLMAVPAAHDKFFQDHG
mgnify:CR=1 FL=1